MLVEYTGLMNNMFEGKYMPCITCEKMYPKFNIWHLVRGLVVNIIILAHQICINTIQLEGHTLTTCVIITVSSHRANLEDNKWHRGYDVTWGIGHGMGI